MSETTTQDYILLILNCNKYREKAITQKNTWLQNIPNNIIYFHVLGNPELSTSFLFDKEQHILYVRCEDDYNSLPKKTFEALMAIYNVYDFKYIFKTDDDQMLINPHFFKIITSILDKNIPKVHYGGKIVDVKYPHISQYYKIHPELPNNLLIQPTRYCNGRFYLLSLEAVMNLSKKKELIYKEYFEDYTIGLNLSPFLKENMFHINTDKYFVDMV